MPKLVDPKLLNLAVLKTSNVQKQMRAVAETKLVNAKKELINDFKAHPVSAEIAGGSSSSNSSGTLGGYGNLFSFIGFNNGDNPVDQWVNFIEQKIRILRKSGERQNGNNGFVLEFQVDQIKNNEYVSNAGMPWESGKSWLISIERGISGFSSFISKKLGRSGGGIQAKSPVRGSVYRTTKYWSPIWTKFIKNLKEL
jgi:hypothetical protein